MTEQNSGLVALVRAMHAVNVANGRSKEPHIRIDGSKRRRINVPDTATKANPKGWQDSEAARRQEEIRKKPPAPKKGQGRPRIKPPKLAPVAWGHDHIEDPYDGSRQRVKRIDSAIPRLRRLHIKESPGILRFIQDCDAEAASLRTASLDSAGTGGIGVGRVPIAAIDALGRLRNIRANLTKQFGKGVYELAYLYLIRGITVEQLHKNGAEQHVVTSGIIREAIWMIEDQYQSGRVRKTHNVALELYDRLVSGGKR